MNDAARGEQQPSNGSVQREHNGYYPVAEVSFGDGSTRMGAVSQGGDLFPTCAVSKCVSRGRAGKYALVSRLMAQGWWWTGVRLEWDMWHSKVSLLGIASMGLFKLSAVHAGN